MNRFTRFFLTLIFSVFTGVAFSGTQDTTFQIVESVPVHSIYGEPGVPRTPKVWMEMISGAQQKIDIAAFYISSKPGDALAPLLDKLIAKSESGVKVRILLDRTFMRNSESSIERLKNVPNLTIRVLPVDSLTGGVLHAKYFIVDDSIVFVGSQNWDWRAMTQIHEIGARIDNRRFARTFEAVFNFDWHLAAHPDLPKAKKYAVDRPGFPPVTSGNPVVLKDENGSQVIASPAFSPKSLIPAWVDEEQPELVNMIHSAQNTLRVQVMTLSALIHYGPKGYWYQVDNALRDAAARGVKVEIIVADWSLHNPLQQYLKSLAVMPNITVKFSTVPQSPEGFIPYARVEHCKYAVADDQRAFIGTGNWEWSYFNNTVDAAVLVSGKGPVKTLISIFDKDWNGPYVTTIKPGVEYKPAKNH
ncbi:MAG: hypothetical protein JXR65_10865 [Bacteroidales bacterium]|nr:hypothetical protein [Bacteroidales bacterium]